MKTDRYADRQRHRERSRERREGERKGYRRENSFVPDFQAPVIVSQELVGYQRKRRK